MPLVNPFAPRVPTPGSTTGPSANPATTDATATGGVGGPTDVQKTLASDAIAGAVPTAKPNTTALGPRQQAVAKLRELVKSGGLDALLAAAPKTGELLSVEARTLFAALPTLGSATSAKDLLDLGLISKIPEGLDAMWNETPRYFVGRQVLVQTTVDTDFKNAVSFHTYKEGGTPRVTHRAYVVGEQGNAFKVAVEGRAEPLLVSKPELYALNEGHRASPTQAKAYGVRLDYDKDIIFKAKVCATILALDDLIGKLDFRTKDPAQLEAALAAVPKPAPGTPAFSGTGSMVQVDAYSQDGVGRLTKGVAAPVEKLLVALGQPFEKSMWGAGKPTIGPMVQRALARLVKEGTAIDLGTTDWPKLAGELQVAVKKDQILALQRSALTTVHGAIKMKHPRDFGADQFGTQYRGEEAGKLVNGGLGVCNVQASVLFGVLQPLRHVLGYETQLEMGACIRPRPGRDGKIMQDPPHGWVIATMWPAGERFVSDRTWHHPCLALDYAFSPNGDRRHVAWDPNVVKTATVTSKQIDMSGTFSGAKPQPVTDATTHGRPDH